MVLDDISLYLNGTSKNTIFVYLDIWFNALFYSCCERETSFVEHLLNSVTARALGIMISAWFQISAAENHHISGINGHLSGWGRCWFINRWYLFDVNPGTGASWQHGTSERAEPGSFRGTERARASITAALRVSLCSDWCLYQLLLHVCRHKWQQNIIIYSMHLVCVFFYNVYITFLHWFRKDMIRIHAYLLLVLVYLLYRPFVLIHFVF